MVTAAQFDDAMNSYAAAELREHAIGEIIEAGVQELTARYDAELIELKTKKQTSFETALSYCMNNKQLLFGKRRSIGTGNAVAGFRLGVPKLKTVKNSNWKSVLIALKRRYRNMCVAQKSRQRICCWQTGIPIKWHRF